MQLIMYIGNDFIEAVALDPARIQKPGYLGQFKRCLKTKYSELIREKGNADFLVTEVPVDKYLPVLNQSLTNSSAKDSVHPA
jgi:hypothetical protein